MKRIIRRLLPSGRFARSVSLLAGGAAAGQLVVIAASPILTRLYTPEDFGLAAIFSALLGILGVIASLRYQLAIPLPASDKTARDLAVLSLLIAFGMTILLAALMWLYGSYFAETLNTPQLVNYLWLLPLGFFLSGAYSVLSHVAIRQRAFGALAQTKLYQAITMTLVQLIGYAFGPVALLIGRVLGQGAGVGTLFRTTKLTGERPSEEPDEPRGMREVASHYRSFPLVSTWSGLASSAGSNLPPLMIASLFGPVSAGVYALAHRVLSQPMVVVGKAVGDVFYRDAAEAHREGRLHLVVAKLYGSLVSLSLPAALFVFLCAPSVFVVLFGRDWEQAGIVARWMTPWLFFQFVVTPPTQVYPILDQHGIALRFQMTLLVSGVGSVLVGYLVFNSLTIAIALMSLSNGCVYFVRIITTYSLVGLRPWSSVSPLVRAAPWALACNLPLLALSFVLGAEGFTTRWGICAIVFCFALVAFCLLRELRTMALRED